MSVVSSDMRRGARHTRHADQAFPARLGDFERARMHLARVAHVDVVATGLWEYERLLAHVEDLYVWNDGGRGKQIGCCWVAEGGL